MTPQRLAILIIAALHREGLLGAQVSAINHPVNVVADVIQERIAYGDVHCTMDIHEEQTLDEAKKQQS